MQFKIDARIAKARKEVEKAAKKYDMAYNKNPKAVQVHRKWQMRMTAAQNRLTELQLIREAMTTVIEENTPKPERRPIHIRIMRWFKQLFCRHNDYVRTDTVTGKRERFCAKCGNIRPIF